MTLVFIAALLAGAIASVTGFGIGSLLTPVFGFQVGIRIATVGVMIGTAIGTRLLTKLPPKLFRQIIGALLLALGVYMISAS